MITWQNGGVYEVAMVGRWNDNQEIRNVTQVQLLTGAPMTYQEGLDDLDAWITDIITILKAIQSVLMIWRGFTVQELNGVNVSGFVPLAAPVPGEVTGDALPPGVAFLQYMPTGESRRQLRKYWGGMPESAVGAFGGYSSATVTAMSALAPLFLNVINETNGTWHVCHSQPGEPSTLVYPQSAVFTAVPSYQRRRRQGRGI